MHIKHLLFLTLAVAASCDEYIHEPAHVANDPLGVSLSTAAAITNPTGRIYATRGAGAVVYQVNNAGAVGFEREFDYIDAYGRHLQGFSSDGNSVVFAATGVIAPPALDVLDRDLSLIARVTVNDPSVVQVRFGAYRAYPAQVFLCETPRIPFARLWVFDVTDVANPSAPRVADIPHSDAGSSTCRDMAFDPLGDLWVTSSGRLIRLSLDATGSPVSSDVYIPGGNPIDVGFEPGTGRLFYSAVNANFVGVVSPTAPEVREATIESVCDDASSSPIGLLFTPQGHLVVGCGNDPGAESDLAIFNAASLTGLNGTVEAADLNVTRLDDSTGIVRSDGSVQGGAGFLAYATVNENPIAEAGPHLASIVGLSVTLSGSGSTDPDGFLISYDWTLGDGNTASGSIINHAYDAPGVYAVTLTVTDDGGLTDDDGTTVIVISVPSAIQALLDQVLLLELQKGIEQSLSAKLLAALNNLPHDVPSTAQQVEAFMAQVEALRGNKLTDTEADALIADAQDIADALTTA